MLADKKKQEFKILASLQGVNIDDNSNDSDEELPPEIAEMEAEFRRKHDGEPSAGPGIVGLGYNYVKE